MIMRIICEVLRLLGELAENWRSIWRLTILDGVVGGGSLDPDFSPSIFTTEELPLLLLLEPDVLDELEDPFVHLMIQPSETMRKMILATNNMLRMFCAAD